jgi:hypothetical protein
MTNLEEFTQGYIAAMYFTETGEDDQPDRDADMDSYTTSVVLADCKSFWDKFGSLIESGDDKQTPTQAGADFWFTRNHHGVGFWEDTDWPIHGNALDTEAKGYAEVYTYATDEGLLAQD